MLGYISGVYDVLRSSDLRLIDERIQKNLERGNKYFALAVYSDSLCKELGIDFLKSAKERISIVSELSGVDFAFEISSKNPSEIEKAAEKALQQHTLIKQPVEENKKYNIAYAPGTYDLFHAGHLEHLLTVAKYSKKVIVGVKSDELVKEHKGREPMINAEERIEILRHFRFVENIYQYYTRDPHAAMKWIEAKYKQPVDAIFLGSDLKEDFKNINDVKLVFTDRDANMMKTRSTSAYIKIISGRRGNISITSKRENNEDLKSKNDEFAK